MNWSPFWKTRNKPCIKFYKCKLQDLRWFALITTYVLLMWYHLNFEAESVSVHGNSDLNNDTCHMEFKTTQKHKLQPKLKLLCISMLMAWGKNRMKKIRSISHWEHAQWFWKLFHRTHHNRNTVIVCETQHKISVIENLLRVSTWCTVNYVGTPQKGRVYYWHRYYRTVLFGWLHFHTTFSQRS